MLKVITSVNEYSNFIDSLANDSIGLVPTMGYLHKGHLKLLEASLKENEISVISIFVNPTQFSRSEDLSKYPRTFEDDFLLINKIASEYNKEVIIFHPRATDEVYPKDYKLLQVKRFEKILEGDVRPTHFKGVISVVKALFDIVNPTRAYFGKKDYQQLIVVKDMVSECKLTVQIRSVEICREQSGLAMSSRNNYLSLEQKQIALKLRTTLLKAAMTLEEEGLKEAQAFCKLAKEDKSFNYLEIRNRKTFMPVQEDDKEFVIVGNYQVNTTRLLDNIEVKVNEF